MTGINTLMKSKSTQLPNYLRKKDNRLKDKFGLLPFGSEFIYKYMTNSFPSFVSSTQVVLHQLLNLKSTAVYLGLNIWGNLNGKLVSLWLWSVLMSKGKRKQLKEIFWTWQGLQGPLLDLPAKIDIGLQI